ncbi:uncharacterized protein LOC125790026 [Astyanax mexicanus]|uniref:uncharacterized protein LOC125790026 n=1 Tax=Astyanax mexicanus TaxID=7994 RepID=UPI0020CAE133|nr:uncharacterized protein LOC125790026 [Astyanax mexicanus]
MSAPEKRYRSGADIVLIIHKVSQSDAGRYYCDGSTVELIVNGNCPVIYSITSTSLPTSTTRTTPAERTETSTTTTVERSAKGPVIYSTTSTSLPTSTTRTTPAERTETSTTTTVERSAKEFWMVFVAVGSVLLLLALASLLSTKCFPKKNAEEDDVPSGDVYTTTEYVNIIKS